MTLSQTARSNSCARSWKPLKDTLRNLDVSVQILQMGTNKFTSIFPNLLLRLSSIAVRRQRLSLLSSCTDRNNFVLWNTSSQTTSTPEWVVVVNLFHSLLDAMRQKDKLVSPRLSLRNAEQPSAHLHQKSLLNSWRNQVIVVQVRVWAQTPCSGKPSAMKPEHDLD